MPEGSPDYEVEDGLPEDQEEEDEAVELSCAFCLSKLSVIVGVPSDIPVVAKASGWERNEGLSVVFWLCPRCQ